MTIEEKRMEEIKRLYLELVQLIIENYEEAYDCKFEPLDDNDKKFLLKHSLSDLVDEIWSYLDDKNPEEEA